MIPLRCHLELLFRYVISSTGKPFTAVQVAQETGVSLHTLYNLLNGHQDNPRLHTLKRLCRCFDVTLDYFNLETEQQCLGYLTLHGKVGAAPNVLQTIETQARTLSTMRAADVLAMLQWRIRGFGK